LIKVVFPARDLNVIFSFYRLVRIFFSFWVLFFFSSTFSKKDGFDFFFIVEPVLSWVVNQAERFQAGLPPGRPFRPLDWFSSFPP